MNEWQSNTFYKKSDQVRYDSKEYVAHCDMHSTVPPDISSNWKLLPKEKPMSIPPGLYVRVDELQKLLHNFPYSRKLEDDLKDLPQYYLSEITSANSEVKQHLIAICKAFDALEEGEAYEDLESLGIFNLENWWSKNKPKTEREEKLEAVVRSISLNGQFTEDLLPVAERVLQALGL
jgi:hypothetical protein